MNKLVRDKIVEIIKSKGEEVSFKVLSRSDYKIELKNKLVEEAKEVVLAKSKKELIDEIADVKEVLDCLLKEQGLTWEDIKAKQKDKNKLRGSFLKRIFLIKQ